MKNFILILIAIIFTSCKNDYQPRLISNVTIEKFDMSGTSIRAIQVLNDSTIFYAGSKGDIGFTKNNGKTWNTKSVCYQDTLTPHFRSIAYDGSNILVLSIENPALLYKYDTKTDSINLIYKEEHKKIFYDCLKFDSNRKEPFGIGVGDVINNKPSIIINTNGTWKKSSSENLPDLDKKEAFFAASNSNIKIIGNTIWIISGGKKSRVIKSLDLGKTWKVYDTPFVQGKSSQGMFSLDFYDEKNGIAVGGDYTKPNKNKNNKAITTDGGLTWKVIANNQNPSYKSCVKYVPDTNGKELFAVGKTGVSFSNDGGYTWKEVSKDAYYAISFADKNTAWLSGDGKIGKMILK